MGISKKELKDMNAYFRALNYISVGQLYLLDNPLLKEELKWSHVKKKIVGHWGTVPGQNFIYTHLNRIIKKNDLNMIYISGPGHGGNAVVSNVYLEGTYSNTYPEVSVAICSCFRINFNLVFYILFNRINYIIAVLYGKGG